MLQKCKNPECKDKPARFLERRDETVWDEVSAEGEFIAEDASKLRGGGEYLCYHCEKPVEFAEDTSWAL